MKKAILAVSLLALVLPQAFAGDSQKSLEQQLAETEARMKQLQDKISPIQSQIDELKKRQEALQQQKTRQDRAVKLEARRQELQGWLSRFDLKNAEVRDANSGIMCSCEDWQLYVDGKPAVYVSAHSRAAQSDSLFVEMLTKDDFIKQVAQKLAENKVPFQLKRDPADPALTIGGDPAAKALFDQWGGKIDGDLMTTFGDQIMLLDGVDSITFKTRPGHLVNSGEQVQLLIIVLDYPANAPKSFVWYKSPTSSAEGFEAAQ